MPPAAHFPASSVTRVSKASLAGEAALLESWLHNNLYSREDLGRESSLSHHPGLLAAGTSPLPAPPSDTSQLLVTFWWIYFPFREFSEEVRPFP